MIKSFIGKILGSAIVMPVIASAVHAACTEDRLDRLFMSQSMATFSIVQPVGKLVSVPFSSIQLAQISAQRFDEPALRVTGIWADLNRKDNATQQYDIEDLKSKPLEFALNDSSSPWEYSWAIELDSKMNQWTLTYYWVCDPYYFENNCVNTTLKPVESFELTCE